MMLKNKPHIFVLLAVLAVGVCLVSPTMAYTITAEPLGGVAHLSQGKITDLTVDMSPDDQAVQRILVDVPTGTSVNFTLWYGSGKTVTGWMEYSPSSSCDDFISFFDTACQYSGVSIGSDTQGYHYRGLQEIGRMDIVGYGRNDTSNQSGFLVYDTVVGVWQGQIMAFYAISDPRDLVIYKFQIESSNPVDITYYTNTRENVLKAATRTPFEAISDWINWLAKFIDTIKAFLEILWAFIYFFFVEYLWLIVALWLGVTMAYSAMSSVTRKGFDVFRFYHKFLRYQQALVKFMVEMWDFFVRIASAVIPWK